MWPLMVCFVEEPAFVLIRKTVHTRLLDPCRAKLVFVLWQSAILPLLPEGEREKKPFPGNFGCAGRDTEECQTKREWLTACRSGRTVDFYHPR